MSDVKQKPKQVLIENGSGGFLSVDRTAALKANFQQIKGMARPATVVGKKKRKNLVKRNTAVDILREIVESWGSPNQDSYWSCDDDTKDCEVRDPRTDNEGIRCEFHDMMRRARTVLDTYDDKEIINA